MEIYKADKRILKIWWIITFSIFFGFTIIYSLILPLFSASWWICLSVSIVAFLLISLVYLPIRYKNFLFYITDDELVVYSGVFSINHDYYSIDKIQFIAYQEGILDRIFGLASIHVYSVGADKVLYGLRIETAQEILNKLSDILQHRSSENAIEKIGLFKTLADMENEMGFEAEKEREKKSEKFDNDKDEPKQEQENKDRKKLILQRKKYFPFVKSLD